MLTTSTFLPYAQRPGEKCGLGVCAADGYRGFKVACDPYNLFSICFKETNLPYYRQNIVIFMNVCP